LRGVAFVLNREAVQFFLLASVVLAVCVTFVVTQGSDADRALGSTFDADSQEREGGAESLQGGDGAVGFTVTDVVGQRESTEGEDPLTVLLVRVEIETGASSFDLRDLVLDVSDGASYRVFGHPLVSKEPEVFTAKSLSPQGADPVVLQGSTVVELRLDLEAAGMLVGPREALLLSLVVGGQELGETTFHSPEEFGRDRAVRLR
jgi:hypothetical protein